jgi:hypothetical protein
MSAPPSFMAEISIGTAMPKATAAVIMDVLPAC